MYSVYTVYVHVCLCTCSETSGEEGEDTRDLKATITHREKQGTKSDSYINYRVVTEVHNVYMYIVHCMYMYIPYSAKFSRHIIFAFFVDWSGTAKIFVILPNINPPN